MSGTNNQLEKLHQELGMLKTAYELFDDPPSQAHILARVLACITEYTHLVDGQINAVIDTARRDSAEDNL